MTHTLRHRPTHAKPTADSTGNRPRVPPLNAASRPRLARFLLRRYLRSAVVKAAGPDRPRLAPPPRAERPAAPTHRHTR
ncbi:hypothetical protein GCM10010215_25890 [Streptomyces virginiae]|uniref:Uncharacterized protein n=1 Tax=Streptomyces virginiae TaxID=1961 RepID=A0ABQ3NN75_STRVG|nr:hypothetical protein [Streptomyces virginiae]MBP2341894.1 hypothetical protein [Streptomyces virginiae]GGP98996.1 hypothetical protein GCM10010215_25890 [Streptomyces virginiae]GHI14232.1 hypothetical protein Scinn_36950 [Streptomyces virginiae]